MQLDSFLAKDNFDKNQIIRPHQTPIYATSSFEFNDIEHGIEVFSGQSPAHYYSRCGNPTVDAVAQKIADLEAFGLDITARGVMVSSGMAAISTLMMGVLQQGDAY